MTERKKRKSKPLLHTIFAHELFDVPLLVLIRFMNGDLAWVFFQVLATKYKCSDCMIFDLILSAFRGCQFFKVIIERCYLFQMK